MNDLKLFENPEFGNVRIIQEDGKPMFCGSDVACALGYAKPRNAITAHCKGALKRGILTPGGNQAMTFIPEGDVYRLIVHSKLPAAERFERWVFDEVLPSIRRTGMYCVPQDYPSALRALAEAEEKKMALEAKVEADRPKVLFADSVSGAKNSIIIRELAKLLRQNGVDIGEKRLFEWMREEGYLIKAKGRDYNTPTQRSVDAGWMEQRETSVSHTSGTHVHFTPLVTGKGQTYFINLFLSRKNEA